MSAPLFRPARPGDTPALRRIWKAAFGDPDAFIQLFFSQFYAPEMATVAEVDGQPVSAGYTFSGLSLCVPGADPIPCAYGYSIGTLPAYRGRGLGGEVTRRMRDRARAEGQGILCLFPAESSLRRWYADIAGGTTAFWMQQSTVSRDALPPSHRPAEPLEPEAYLALREQLLAQVPHIRFSESLLRFQAAICRLSGGGLYALGDAGCAIVEYAEQQARVKELLVSGDLRTALAPLAQLRPAEQLAVRTPCVRQQEALPSAMALCGGSELPKTAIPAYWGPVFD